MSSPAIDRRAVPDPFAAPVADVLEGLDRRAGWAGPGRSAASRRALGTQPAAGPERASPLFVRIFKHFDDVLIYILLAAAVLKAIDSEWIDFWVHPRVAVDQRH